MAQLDFEELFQLIVRGDQDLGAFVRAVVDRKSGQVLVREGKHLDFKQTVQVDKEQNAAELARDILAFSNTEGGILLLGVTDSGKIVGHSSLESRYLREKLGLYMGTRPDFETANPKVAIKGNTLILPVVLVRKTTRPYPNLLRRHIEYRTGLGRKVKYRRGSLFYRSGETTLVEPTGGDIDGRAIALGFYGGAPRTRSSFILDIDKPRARLYENINDRFFGREAERTEFQARFDDARGRGISIAGQGGIGKTELAITVTRHLFDTGKFKCVYSGSAKQRLLGPVGAQQADPVFYDHPSFLRDLLAWLGLDSHPQTSVPDLESEVLVQFQQLDKVLLFVDNLETVEDGRLFDFLDNKLPQNIWLLATSRVHKVKNYVYSVELGALGKRDAARLLRYECKRQGLQDIADQPIQSLEDCAEKLYRHPLAIRWYAWKCCRDPVAWQQGPEKIPKKDLESFCVGHTLQNLSAKTLRILAACASSERHATLSPACIKAISGVSGFTLEKSLYDLECAGLLSSNVNEETGQVVYSVAPIAVAPGQDIARHNNWEREFTFNLKKFVASQDASLLDDPLLRDLIEFNPKRLREMLPQEIRDIQERAERVRTRAETYEAELLALEADCERHLNNPITADRLYEQAASIAIKSGKVEVNKRYQRLLLEAATVAKHCGPAKTQLRRAIGYLEAIRKTQFNPLRVLGTLVEYSAIIGDKERYSKYLERVKREKARLGYRSSFDQLLALEEALDRAQRYMKAEAI